jgi:enterochelin esterase family protein
MLSAQRRHPELLDGMVLQSGSYFTPRLDPQESGYSRFDQICAAVVGLIAGPAANQGPVFMTCGLVEENRPNNEKMAQALSTLGYAVRLDLVPDAHTMIGWRDAWSPAMEELIEQTGTRRQARQGDQG